MKKMKIPSAPSLTTMQPTAAGVDIGAREIYNQIAAWHQRYGARWAPAPLLREAAERGGQLRELRAPQVQ